MSSARTFNVDKEKLKKKSDLISLMDQVSRLEQENRELSLQLQQVEMKLDSLLETKANENYSNKNVVIGPLESSELTEVCKYISENGRKPYKLLTFGCLEVCPDDYVELQREFGVHQVDFEQLMNDSEFRSNYLSRRLEELN